MAHILTDEEALAVLRRTTADDCPTLEMLLNAVDDGLLTETGKDWSIIDTESGEKVDPTAKLAASLLLVALDEGTEPPKSYYYKVAQLDAKVKLIAAEETV